MDFDRRGALIVAGAALTPALARALAIDAEVRTRSLADIEHVVIFTPENRAFDHYFGAMNGVRGFADRFPVPVPDAPGREGLTVWTQLGHAGPSGEATTISPFPLNTLETYARRVSPSITDPEMAGPAIMTQAFRTASS